MYKKYCLTLGGLLLGTVALVIAPSWLMYRPYGMALLLSLPPMVVCALSWMAGTWWAWNKNRRVFIVVTLGAIPVRLFLGLVWALFVLSLPQVPFTVFVLGLMWHWLVFTIPEIAMLREFSKKTDGTPTP